MRGRHACVNMFFAALPMIGPTLVAAPADAQTPPENCERLSALHLSGATIRLAQTVAAGTFTPPAATDGDGARRVNPVFNVCPRSAV